MLVWILLHVEWNEMFPVIFLRDMDLENVLVAHF